MFFRSNIMTFLLFLLLLNHLQHASNGQNVDTESPSLFQMEALIQDRQTSMFGHSVLMTDDDSDGAMFVIGAPNSTDFIRTSQDSGNYGKIFHCPVSDSRPFQSEISCFGIDLFENLKSYSSKLFTPNMRLGWNLIQRKKETKEILTCPFSRTNNIQVINANGQIEYWPVPNGVCFLIPEGFVSPHKAPPNSNAKLIFPMQGEEQFMNGEYLLAYGMAGISAAFSLDENAVFMGAPGYDNWKGAVASAELTNLSNRKPSLEYDIGLRSWPSLEKDTYLGYSVSTGRYFHDNSTFIVAGAPRRNLFGSVFLFETSETSPPAIKIDGQQLGEYFGYSLLTIDINRDNYDDLLVSAPMYSSLQRHFSDEGRVFFYLSSGNQEEGFRKPILLHGDSKPFARFGTAMANLGDINKDGFPDVVIGAPYEDDFKGTIYIYCGMSTGLTDQYSQRISAGEHLKSYNLKGFGYSFSSNVDIDGNHFPDILVGAYLSANALLLRTRPSITIQPSILLKQDYVDLNQPCLFEDKDLAKISNNSLSCVRLRYCFRITSPMNISLSKISLMASLKLDETFNRAFVIVANGSLVNSNDNSGIYRRARIVNQQFLLIPFQNNYCSDDYWIYIKETGRIDNLIDPIRFDLEYSIEHYPEIDINDPQQRFHAPMLSNSRTNITAEVDIHLCNKSAKDCVSDLILSTGFYFDDDPEPRRFANNSQQELIEGEQRLITLNVQVRNRAEPSFKTMVIVRTEQNVTAVQLDKRCQLLHNKNGHKNAQTFQCRLDDPLFQMDSVNLTFNAFLVKDAEIVHFRIEISNYNQKSNHTAYEVSFKMIKKSQIELKAIPNYSMDKGYPQFRRISLQLNQMIQIKRLGPSSIDQIEIDLIYPNSYDGNEIITDIQAKTIDNHVKLECDGPKSFVKYENQSSSSIYKQIDPRTRLVDLDCSNTKINCQWKKCHLGPLKVMPNNKHDPNDSIHGSIFVRLNIVANLTSIKHKFRPDQFPRLIISVDLMASINDTANDNSGSVKHDRISIYRKQASIEIHLNWWWYILAIFLGICILIFIVWVLYWYGFFKRTKVEAEE